jgi:hypothetical protein
MIEQLKEATQPLHQYIRLFDDYVEFLNTDVSEHVRSHEERNLRSPKELCIACKRALC